MDSELENVVWQMSPNLKHGTAKIISCQVVHWVNQNNCTQDRIFVVATNGIFLGRKKSLSSIELTSEISYFDLVSISVGGTLCTFSSNSDSIRIRSENIENIAYLVYFVRQAQFSTSVLPINLNFQNAGSFNMKDTAKSYKSRHVFADRIGSCALHYKLELFADEMDVFYNSESLPHNTFEIDPLISSFTLIRPLALALTFEQDLRTFIINHCNVANIFGLCYSIFVCNKFLDNIVFKQCDFTNASNVLNQLFDKATFLPSHWTFEGCDCSSSSFTSFFEKLTDHSKKIKSLTFIDSNHSSQSLMTIFQTILFNDCFHNLEKFEIQKIDDVKDFHIMINSIASSSWALTSKCIKRIQVSNSNQNISKLFENIVSMDIGLTEVCLSNNKFLDTLEFHRDGADIGFLDLSNCVFSVDAILSFFNALYEGKVKITGLDLSNITIENDSLTDVLSYMAMMKQHFKSIERFFFDKNKMNSKQTNLFATFLRNNSQLRSLSLNQSIDISDTSSSFRSICVAISQLSLDGLFIRGGKRIKYAYGPLLTPVLRYLAVRKTIKVLDITNQRIGDDGLNTLMQFLQKGSQLISLKFDGCCSGSFNKISTFCQRVIASKLVFASWPSMEFERHYNLIPRDSGEKPTIAAEIEMLKSTYVERFGYLCVETESTKMIFNQERIRDYKPTKDNNMTRSASSMEIDKSQLYLEKFEKYGITKRDDEIVEILSECVGNAYTDPVITMLGNFHKTYNLEKIRV